IRVVTGFDMLIVSFQNAIEEKFIGYRDTNQNFIRDKIAPYVNSVKDSLDVRLSSLTLPEEKSVIAANLERIGDEVELFAQNLRMYQHSDLYNKSLEALKVQFNFNGLKATLIGCNRIT